MVSGWECGDANCVSFLCSYQPAAYQEVLVTEEGPTTRLDFVLVPDRSAQIEGIS